MTDAPRPDPRSGRGRVLVTALVVALAVVAIDQVTTSVALAGLRHGPVQVLGLLRFALAFNTGSAFSLFTGWAPLLAAVAVLLVAALAAIAWQVRRTGVAVALGLVIGGAMGNLADRLFRGHHGAVIDFIDLRFWPTFNLADAAIVVGIIVLAILLWRRPLPRELRRSPAANSSRVGGDARS